jgi:hypothetical protein
MKKKQFEELLWRSFDKGLTLSEQNLLQKELERSAEFRSMQQEAIALRNSVRQSVQPDFAPAFADRVIRRLQEQNRQKSAWESFSISLPDSFRRVAYAGVAAFLLLVVYNIAEGNSLAVERLLGKENITIDRAYDPALHLYRDIKQ